MIFSWFHFGLRIYSVSFQFFKNIFEALDVLYLGESSMRTRKYLLVVKGLKSYINSLPGERYLEKPFSWPNPEWYRTVTSHAAQQSVLKSLPHFLSVPKLFLIGCYIAECLPFWPLMTLSVPPVPTLSLFPDLTSHPLPMTINSFLTYGKFPSLKLKNVCPPPHPHRLIKNLLCDPSSLECRGDYK